jgi:hypothetical protein
VQYLKEEQYYNDLYDLITIKDCLDSIAFWRKAYQDKKSDKSASEDDKLKAYSIGLNLDLFQLKGERCINRQQHIREMIDKDKQKQEFYDNATEPSSVYCQTCGRQLYSDFKILEDYTDKPMRVLFYFPCKTCKKKRGFYNTGEEHISKPELCQKCGYEIKTSYKEKGKVVTTIRKCTHCNFSETEVEDFGKQSKEWEKKQAEDRLLLEKYRSQFCLSEKEGQEYVVSKENIKQMAKMVDEFNQKQADPAYQKAKKLKKLSVVELEKLLVEALEKEKFIKLSLDKPEIGQHVIIPFTVQDANSSRKDHESTGTLQKIIRKLLDETNWRLMSEGTTYRLGYIYGRLKGYEREEDLANLVRKIKEQDKPVMETEDGPIY